MTHRFLVAFLVTIGGSFNANQTSAQYQQANNQYPQYQQQPMMNGPGMNQNYSPGMNQNSPGMYQASARMRQDQAIQAVQPRAPMMEAPVNQAPQNGFSAPPPLAPSMVAPSYGSDYVGHGSCGCGGGNNVQGYQGHSNGNQVGQNYFGRGNDCGDGCCETETQCGCLERYVRVFGGWNWLQDVESGFQTTQGGRASFNDGWAIGGAIGKYMTPNARRELEFTYRNNTADSIFIPTPIPIDGLINCYSLMGNLVYELPRLQIASLKPYIGGGVGVAYLDGEFAGGAATVDDTVFAYQGFFGVNRQLSAQAKLFAEYRYFATSEVDVEGAILAGSDEYQANNLFFGLQLAR